MAYPDLLFSLFAIPRRSMVFKGKGGGIVQAKGRDCTSKGERLYKKGGEIV
jgi:hypothetical protein